MNVHSRPSRDSARDAEPQDPLQALLERVEAGDFATVLDWCIHAPPGAYGAGKLDQLLRRAIEQASRKSPQRFADAGFGQAISFVLYVLMRFQASTMPGLVTPDAEARGRRGDLPEGFAREILPAIERLSRLFGELSQARASTARLWSLTRRRGQRRVCNGRCRRPGTEPLQELLDGVPEDLPRNDPRRNGRPL
jgi:hypothetical protein